MKCGIIYLHLFNFLHQPRSFSLSWFWVEDSSELWVNHLSQPSPKRLWDSSSQRGSRLQLQSKIQMTSNITVIISRRLQPSNWSYAETMGAILWGLISKPPSMAFPIELGLFFKLSLSNQVSIDCSQWYPTSSISLPSKQSFLQCWKHTCHQPRRISSLWM